MSSVKKNEKSRKAKALAGRAAKSRRAEVKAAKRDAELEDQEVAHRVDAAYWPGHQQNGSKADRIGQGQGCGT